ncbi:MAG: T9SS C-terminal target domain-containing protein, partial [Balneolaceae bacterium]
DGETYVVFANGVLNPDNFAANPGELSIGFTLIPVASAREAAENTENVEFFVFHGATDAPAVDVLAGEAKLVDGAAYGDATGYLSVPAGIYSLDVTPAGANETIVANFNIDLSGAAGASAVVFASGFLSPANNQDGDSFVLALALADGTVLVVTPTSTERVETGIPVEFALEQNYPNPFNPTTQISYSLPQASDVTLTVYNIQGQRVATLVNNRVEAGRHTVTFEANGLASGLYLYRITTGSFSQTAKMMLVK